VLGACASMFLVATSGSSAAPADQPTESYTILQVNDDFHAATAYAINNHGYVAGWCMCGQSFAGNAFIGRPGAGMSDLSNLGGRGSSASALNDHHQNICTIPGTLEPA